MDQALVVIATDNYSDYGLLNSTFHSSWAEYYRSSIGKTTYYIPTAAFEPFPFPLGLGYLVGISKEYDELRQQLMLDRQEGLTTTYNRFHDPAETAQDITHLRHLHVEMDNAVAAAYGWQDLALGHGFHETATSAGGGVRYTISEAARREVLTRLLKLNHQRYEEEVKLGLHEKKRGSKGAATKGRSGQGRKKKAEGRGQKKKNDGQLSLF